MKGVVRPKKKGAGGGPCEGAVVRPTECPRKQWGPLGSLVSMFHVAFLGVNNPLDQSGIAWWAFRMTLLLGREEVWTGGP